MDDLADRWAARYAMPVEYGRDVRVVVELLDEFYLCRHDRHRPARTDGQPVAVPRAQHNVRFAFKHVGNLTGSQLVFDVQVLDRRDRNLEPVPTTDATPPRDECGWGCQQQ